MGDVGQNVGRGPSLSIDIERSPDLEALLSKIAETVGNRASDGLVLRSVSHALDPDDAEGRWSALMVFSDLREDEIEREPTS